MIKELFRRLYAIVRPYNNYTLFHYMIDKGGHDFGYIQDYIVFKDRKIHNSSANIEPYSEPGEAIVAMLRADGVNVSTPDEKELEAVIRSLTATPSSGEAAREQERP